MPNICLYEMKVRGTKDTIQRIHKCLTVFYNYTEGQKPVHPHFFRVFDTHKGKCVDNDDGTFTAWFYGACAWSVEACMGTGEWSYYQQCKEGYSEIFNGTTLEEQSHDCEIEVFSFEPGIGFSEHCLYDHGQCLANEVDETAHAVGIDEEGNVIENPDWATYDGDCEESSSFYDCDTHSYRWTI